MIGSGESCVEDSFYLRMQVPARTKWLFRRDRITGAVDRDKSAGNEVVAMITGVNEKSGEASAFA
jgi:hypothetical protein